MRIATSAGGGILNSHAIFLYFQSQGERLSFFFRRTAQSQNPSQCTASALALRIFYPEIRCRSPKKATQIPPRGHGVPRFRLPCSLTPGEAEDGRAERLTSERRTLSAKTTALIFLALVTNAALTLAAVLGAGYFLEHLIAARLRRS